MNIRLHGTKEECAYGVNALMLAPGMRLVSVSEPYPDRGASTLVRVYVEARLDDQPGSVRVPGTTQPGSNPGSALGPSGMWRPDQ